MRQLKRLATTNTQTDDGAYSFSTTNNPWSPCTATRDFAPRWRAYAPWCKDTRVPGAHVSAIHPQSRTTPGHQESREATHAHETASAPVPKFKGASWAAMGAPGPLGTARCPLNRGCPRGAPPALTFDHLGHQRGPCTLPAHDSTASGRRGGGKYRAAREQLAERGGPRPHPRSLKSKV